MKTLNYFFDFLSPYSYFSWFGIQDLKREFGASLQVKFYPVVLGRLLAHWDIKGPASVAPKRDYLFRHCLRYSSSQGLPFKLPEQLPFNSLYALRLSLHATSGEMQERVIDCLWKLGWQQGKNLGDPGVLVEALDKQGLPGSMLLEESFNPATKRGLKDNIELALSQGVFGVPSFVLGEELFWGNESLKDLRNALLDQDPFSLGPARQEYQRYLENYFHLS